MKRLIIVWVLACPSAAWATHTEHVVLVTLDGVRWQDVFRGAAPELLADETYVKDPSVRARFQGDTLKQRRVKLLPFFWHRLAKDGVVWGDRDQNSPASVTNPYYFSYPGYNEMLTDVADPAIDSNDNVWNPNVTVLEWLRRRTGSPARWPRSPPGKRSPISSTPGAQDWRLMRATYPRADPRLAPRWSCSTCFKVRSPNSRTRLVAWQDGRDH